MVAAERLAGQDIRSVSADTIAPEYRVRRMWDSLDPDERLVVRLIQEAQEQGGISKGILREKTRGCVVNTIDMIISGVRGKLLAATADLALINTSEPGHPANYRFVTINQEAELGIPFPAKPEPAPAEEPRTLVTNEMATRNDPLAKKIAGGLSVSYHDPALDFQDFYQAARVGLLEAIGKYDPTKGAFSSYAFPIVRGRVLDMIRELDPRPRSIVERIQLINEKEERIMQRDGNQPTEEELCVETGLTKRQLREAKVLAIPTYSIDVLIGNEETNDGKSTPVSDTIADKDYEDPTVVALKNEMLSLLKQAVARLPEREQLLMNLYYKSNKTMREIAYVLDITESRVSKLHARALKRLRERIEPTSTSRKAVPNS